MTPTHPHLPNTSSGLGKLARRIVALAVSISVAACTSLPPDAPAAAVLTEGKSESLARIAVATAYDPELAALLPDLSNSTEHRLNGVSFWTGELSGQPVVLFKTGVSMVNATMNTQLLLDHFNISHILVSGVAGGLDPSLSVGDVTVPASWAQYNEGAYLRETSPGTYTPHPGVEPVLPAFGFMGTRAVRIARDADPQPQPKLWFDADPQLLAIAERVSGDIQLKQCDAEGLCLPNAPKVVPGGRGVTGSTFMDNGRFREYLFDTFDAQVVEMETAAIAMVAYANDVPYIAFRSLSDLAGGGNAAENEITAFEHLAAENAAILVHAYLEAYGAGESAETQPTGPQPATCEIHYSTLPIEPKPMGPARTEQLRAHLTETSAQQAFLTRFDALSLRIANAMAKESPLDPDTEVKLVWGGYAGSVDPSLTMTLAAPTPEARDLATRIGAALGYVFFQQSVAIECLAPADGLSEAAALILTEEGNRDVLSSETLRSVYGMMIGQDGGNTQQGFTYYPGSDAFLVLDLGPSEGARPVMNRVLRDLGQFAPDAGLKLTESKRWIKFPFNDWLTSPNGEKYIEAGLTEADTVLLTDLRGEYFRAIDALPSQ